MVALREESFQKCFRKGEVLVVLWSQRKKEKGEDKHLDHSELGSPEQGSLPALESAVSKCTASVYPPGGGSALSQRNDAGAMSRAAQLQRLHPGDKTYPWAAGGARGMCVGAGQGSSLAHCLPLTQLGSSPMRNQTCTS